jgi:Zn-finger nucleic acid-binding protein
LKLVACSECHAQFDVSDMAPDSEFDCRCGTTLRATPPETTDVPLRRCTACGAIARNDEGFCEYCGAGIVAAIDRGSLICPECYARNLDDARFCLGCGVAFNPQAPPSDMPELRCPCCECWMAAREVGGLEIYECQKCFGLWAPEDRFDALVDRATTAATSREAEDDSSLPRVDGGNPMNSSVEYRRCPTCDSLMTRRNFKKRSGVIVDRCHEHGTWLDANELERIAGYVLSGRAAEAETTEVRLGAQREKRATRKAVFTNHESSAESYSVFGGFGHAQKTSAASSIFDLLAGLLR